MKLTFALAILLASPLVAAHPRLIGITAPFLAPSNATASTAIVAVNVSSGVITQLSGDPEAFYTLQTAFDQARRIFYTFPYGNLIAPFNVSSAQWVLPRVSVNVSRCDSSGCIQEMHWDASCSRLVATAVGYYHPLPTSPLKNAIVAIDPPTGNVSVLHEFAANCAVYDDASAISPKAFYQWMTCGATEMATLVEFSLVDATRSTISVMPMRQLFSPCVFVEHVGLVGVSSNNSLLLVGVNTTKVLSGPLPGLVANGGLSWQLDAGRPFAYASLINFSKRSVVRVDLSTGKVSAMPMASTVVFVQADAAAAAGKKA